MTVPIGLGIGRLVFRALNAAEALFAVIIMVALAAGSLPVRVVVPLAVAVAVLAAQILLVRPRLSRRSNAVLAGQDAPPRAPWR